MPGPNVPFPPMEAQLVAELPEADDWQYEPKWDGHLNPSAQRCVEGIGWCLEREGLSRPRVELGGDRVELVLAEL